MNVEKDSTLITQIIPADSQKKLTAAKSYYKKHLIKLNLRSSDYMKEFKGWITDQNLKLDAIPAKFQEHVEILKDVNEVYAAYFWPEHQATCKKVLDDNIDLIRQTEEKFAYGMMDLTRKPWQREKIKVKITYYGTASNCNFEHRPYTTLTPTHVVMTAHGANDIPGNWVELLFHESAHHLIFSKYYFIGGTIEDITEIMGTEPRQFWHAYLFYLTGELTKQIFEEQNLTYETTYMQRKVVFGRYYHLLDKYLKAYMQRNITLEEATRKILTELNP
ncbi:MAG: hypothetical protein R3345_01175 [Fulvivirga sp.]|nr:hypothetical protein [Fulvivirga sp.]